MGLCHSHNTLCECVFAGNVEYGVVDVATSKCEVDRDKKGLFV